MQEKNDMQNLIYTLLITQIKLGVYRQHDPASLYQADERLSLRRSGNCSGRLWPTESGTGHYLIQKSRGAFVRRLH